MKNESNFQFCANIMSGPKLLTTLNYDLYLNFCFFTSSQEENLIHEFQVENLGLSI